MIISIDYCLGYEEHNKDGGTMIKVYQYVVSTVGLHNVYLKVYQYVVSTLGLHNVYFQVVKTITEVI